MFQNIKNIIFDLGGVIINIDYLLTQKAFEDLGLNNFSEIYTQFQQDAVFDMYETGKITTSDFIAAIKQHIDSASELQIIDAWNAMLLDIPLRRLQILQQLQIYFNTFLLSNTNELHESNFNQKLKLQTGFQNFGVFFDKVYLSHRMGMRKPNKETFEHILNENSLQPEQTLFIDDSPQHIEGAKSVHIQTILLQKGMTMENDIFKPKQ